MTPIEKALVERWIIENIVDETVVPMDEYNYDALRYNLVQLLHHGENWQEHEYKYLPEQDAIIASWAKK